MTDKTLAERVADDLRADASAQGDALAKAATLARRSGATLELFICDFDPSLSGQPFFDTDQLRLLRRARGYAPVPVALPAASPEPLIAVGPHLKNTFTLAREGQAG